MKHQPRKRFGQNFLQSDHIINDIIRAIHPKPSDNIVEIGPGQGALTLPLLKQVKHLSAIEIDRDLHLKLKEAAPEGQLNLIAADALTIDFQQFGENLRVVGNLPYNVATPIIFKLLNYTSQINDMHFMVQKEVADRLASTPGNKQYGRLGIMVQYHCFVEKLFEVPPDAFYPKPKINSAVVRISPYKTCPYPQVPVKKLEALVAQAFSMRRKTLANNLKTLIAPESLLNLGIDPQWRPEKISITQYAQIAKFVSK